MTEKTWADKIAEKVKQEGMVNYCGWCGKKLPSYSKHKSCLCKECGEGLD